MYQLYYSILAVEFFLYDHLCSDRNIRCDEGTSYLLRILEDIYESGGSSLDSFSIEVVHKLQ